MSGDVFGCYNGGTGGGGSLRVLPASNVYSRQISYKAHDPHSRSRIMQLKRSVVKDSHFAEVISGWRPLWGKGAHHVGIWGKRFQAEERAHATSVMRQNVWYVERTVRIQCELSILMKCTSRVSEWLLNVTSTFKSITESMYTSETSSSTYPKLLKIVIISFHKGHSMSLGHIFTFFALN